VSESGCRKPSDSNEHSRRDQQTHNLASSGAPSLPPFTPRAGVLCMLTGCNARACQAGACVRHSTSLSWRGDSQWSSKGGVTPQRRAQADHLSSPSFVCSLLCCLCVLPSTAPRQPAAISVAQDLCSVCASVCFAPGQRGRRGQTSTGRKRGGGLTSRACGMLFARGAVMQQDA
jgi:hypothetical protein